VSELQQSDGNERIIQQEKQKNVLSVMHQVSSCSLTSIKNAD
jgi:hypothetical protein